MHHSINPIAVKVRAAALPPLGVWRRDFAKDPPPALGEHTDRWLREVGLGRRDRAAGAEGAVQQKR